MMKNYKLLKKNGLSENLIAYCNEIKNMAKHLKPRRQYPTFKPFELENKIAAVLKVYKQIVSHDDKPNKIDFTA